jgi:hypothetical protein
VRHATPPAKTVLDAPPSRFAPDPSLFSSLKPIEPPPLEPEVPEDETGTETDATTESESEETREPRRVTVGGYSNVTPITPAISKERLARENYLLKSRELEHAAKERLAHEQRRLELRIRDQLDHEKRELGLVLDDELEDTVIMPTFIADGKA